MKRCLLAVLLCLLCSWAYTEDPKVPARTFLEFVGEASGNKPAEDRRIEPRAFSKPLLLGPRAEAFTERVVVTASDIVRGDDRIYVLFQPKETFHGRLVIRFRPIVNKRPLSAAAESVTLRGMSPQLCEIPFAKLHLADEVRRFEEAKEEGGKGNGFLDDLVESGPSSLPVSIDIIEFGAKL